MSLDQTGSRWIQSQFSHASQEEIEELFDEVYENIILLGLDVFGNYVIQKMFDHVNLEKKSKLGTQLIGKMRQMSFDVNLN